MKAARGTGGGGDCGGSSGGGGGSSGRGNSDGGGGGGGGGTTTGGDGEAKGIRKRTAARETGPRRAAKRKRHLLVELSSGCAQALCNLQHAEAQCISATTLRSNHRATLRATERRWCELGRAAMRPAGGDVRWRAAGESDGACGGAGGSGECGDPDAHLLQRRPAPIRVREGAGNDDLRVEHLRRREEGAAYADDNRHIRSMRRRTGRR